MRNLSLLSTLGHTPKAGGGELISAVAFDLDEHALYAATELVSEDGEVTVKVCRTIEGGEDFLDRVSHLSCPLNDLVYLTSLDIFYAFCDGIQIICSCEIEPVVFVSKKPLRSSIVQIASGFPNPCFCYERW